MFLDFIMGRDMLNSKSKSPLLTPRIGQNKMEWNGIEENTRFTSCENRRLCHTVHV